MRRIAPQLRRLIRKETGTASVEFVLMFPVVFALFLVSFESGFMALRATMLDRALDLTVRDLRLGNLKAATVDDLRQSLCKRTDIFRDCANSVTIELTRIDPAFANLPSAQTRCRRREAAIVAGTPAQSIDAGQDNELMVVRACVAVEALFPTAFMGVKTVRTEKDGTYALVAISAFVNEPN